MTGCLAFSPNKPLEPSHPDFFYYGIHGAEILFTIMGPGLRDGEPGQNGGDRPGRGCLERRPSWHASGDSRRQGVISALWSSADKGIARSGGWDGYAPLLVEVAEFFKTGKAPVSAEETLAIYAFMEAADESNRQGGCPVSVAEVLDKARRAGTRP